MSPRDALRAVMRAARRCPACTATNAENRGLRERLESAEARLDDQHEINGRLMQGAAEQDARIKKYKAGEFANSATFVVALRLLEQALHDTHKARADLAAARDTIARQDALLVRLSHASVERDFRAPAVVEAVPEGGEAA